MAPFGNIAADLNFAQLFAANVNSNSQSAPLDVSNYLGIIGVVLNAGNGASGTQLKVNFATGNDTNYSNSVDLAISPANITNVASQSKVGIDTRNCRKYLYMNYLISGSATANTFLDATVVAQAKYKTS